MNEHELQAAFRRLSAQRAPGRAACIAPEALMRLAAGDGGEAERLAWLDHVAGCAECRADLDVARAVADAGRAFERRRVPAAWLAIAASVLLVTGGIAVWRSRAPAPGDVMRGEADGVVLVTPVGTVPAAAAGRLVWRAAPGEPSYDVEVLDPAGAAVWTLTTVDTSATMPAGVLRREVEYRWRVTAILPTGGRRASPAASLRVH